MEYNQFMYEDLENKFNNCSLLNLQLKEKIKSLEKVIKRKEKIINSGSGYIRCLEEEIKEMSGKMYD